MPGGKADVTLHLDTKHPLSNHYGKLALRGGEKQESWKGSEKPGALGSLSSCGRCGCSGGGETPGPLGQTNPSVLRCRPHVKGAACGKGDLERRNPHQVRPGARREQLFLGLSAPEGVTLYMGQAMDRDESLWPGGEQAGE